MNKNTPFNNPFRARFRNKKDNTIIILKRIELELDDAVVVKNLNKEIISINDLTPNDLLRIKTSTTEPFKILKIQVLPNPTPTPSPTP
jgi:hypothetical protein